ncbi:MAG: hypothetical protein LBM98_08935 [Oscillospiraceae bacterium]|nr:hypothetical protein [Oscillospiraceae bacterium]
MRSTGTLAIRRALQVRSNPVPGGQHTAYVPTYRRILRQPWIASPHIINYVSQVRRRLRNDGQGVALPRPGAMRRGDFPAWRAWRAQYAGWAVGAVGGFETRPYKASSNSKSAYSR